MKTGWEVKALGDVCDFKGGSQPPKSQFIHEPQPGYVRMLQIRDFKTDNKAVYIPITDKTNQCAETDIMIGRYGASVGQIHRGKSGAYNVALIRTIPDKKYIDQDYLYHYLTSDLFQKPLISVSKRGAQDGFSKPDIAPFQIPLPPLEEQKRIVSILDEAFEGLDRARENAEANLQSARELFDRTANSQLTASLEAKRVALGDVASIPSSLVDPKLPEFLDQPHVGAGNMVTGRDVLIDVKTSREEGLKSGKYTFDGNMVLYSKIRPYLRKVARPDFVGLCSADMYPLLPDISLLDKDYLFHLLLSDDFTSYAITGSDRAGMPKVNQTHLFKYQFSLPSIKSQKIVVQAIDLAMEKSELLQTDYRTKLQDISDLRQSLLQKAFAGELT